MKILIALQFSLVTGLHISLAWGCPWAQFPICLHAHRADACAIDSHNSQADTRRKLSLPLRVLDVIIQRPIADVEIVTLAGLEPAIFGSEDQRLIH